MKVFKLLKELGYIPILVTGGVITAGIMGGSIAGIVYEDKVKETIYNVADVSKRTLTNALDTFHNTIHIVNSTASNVSTTINKLNKELTNQTNTLKDISSQLNGVTVGNASIKNDLDSLINQVEKITPELTKLETNIQNGTNQIENFVDSDIVRDIENLVNKTNNILGEIQDPNNPIWKYYRMITNSLLIISAFVFATLILGLVLRYTTQKKVDGVWVNRTHVQHDIKKHVKKILKKYPDLAKKILESRE